jgi:hypothetical protein
VLLGQTLRVPDLIPHIARAVRAWVLLDSQHHIPSTDLLQNDGTCFERWKRADFELLPQASMRSGPPAWTNHLDCKVTGVSKSSNTVSIYISSVIMSIYSKRSILCKQ